jgi:hypothetical protein
VGDHKHTRVKQRILHLDVAAAALKLVSQLREAPLCSASGARLLPLGRPLCSAPSKPSMQARSVFCLCCLDSQPTRVSVCCFPALPAWPLALALPHLRSRRVLSLCSCALTASTRLCLTTQSHAAC